MALIRLRYIGERPVGPDHPVFVTAEIRSVDTALAST